MNNELPKIPFFKKSESKIECEVFSIKSLFDRQNTIANQLAKPHFVDFYVIIYITRGSGAHYLDFKPYRYRKGSMIFVSQGQVHAFDGSADVEGFVILFTDGFLSRNIIHSDILAMYRLHNYHLHEPVIQPEQKDEEIFRKTVDEMYGEYRRSNDFAKEEILRLLLRLLLLRAERIKRILIPKEANTEWLATFSDFKKHLEKKFSDTRNAKEYAEMMGISYIHLNKACKSITGNTVKAFIDQFIIIEAKRRLGTSDISIKELTYALGFAEPTNFLKFFKKHAGQTPRQFKKSLSKFQSS